MNNLAVDWTASKAGYWVLDRELNRLRFWCRGRLTPPAYGAITNARPTCGEPTRGIVVSSCQNTVGRLNGGERFQVELSKYRSGSFAHRRLHWKFTRNQVAERIAHMRAFRIGLVELDQRIAMRIGFPRLLRSPGSDVGSVDPPGADAGRRN